MPTRLPPALALTLSLTFTAACGSASPLMLKPNDALLPIVNGEDPGEATGRCVRFAETGPVTAPCPLGVERFFEPARAFEMDKPGAHLHGVYTWGGTVDRAAETVVAFELVTYTSRAMPWKAKLKPKDLPTLRNLCADVRRRAELVIVRAFEGCSVVLSGTRRDAWRWTLADLAAKGTTIGQPVSFWAQAPDLDQPPSDSRCQTQRVVQVEVLPLGRACDRYQADLFPPPPPDLAATAP